MDCGGPVIDLQHETLLTLAKNLLVHDLNVLETAAVRFIVIFDRNSESVFESLQVQLFRFQLRQFAQRPVFILLVLLNTQIVDFVHEILLQNGQR